MKAWKKVQNVIKINILLKKTVIYFLVFVHADINYVIFKKTVQLTEK